MRPTPWSWSMSWEGTVTESSLSLGVFSLLRLFGDLSVILSGPSTDGISLLWLLLVANLSSIPHQKTPCRNGSPLRRRLVV